MRLKTFIAENKIENCLFMVPMRPLRSVLGMLFYRSNDDEEVNVPCIISESRYKMSENYKVTLRCLYPSFGEEHYYITDLERLIERGIINAYSKHREPK